MAADHLGQDAAVAEDVEELQAPLVELGLAGHSLFDELGEASTREGLHFSAFGAAYDQEVDEPDEVAVLDHAGDALESSNAT